MNCDTPALSGVGHKKGNMFGFLLFPLHGTDVHNRHIQLIHTREEKEKGGFGLSFCHFASILNLTTQFLLIAWAKAFF